MIFKSETNSSLKTFKILVVLLLIFFYSPKISASGQNPDDYPVYIVQQGDTLTTIAQRFGITPQDIINANNIADPNFIPIGTPLVIPSLAGVSGTLTTSTVPFGQNIRNLSLAHQMPVEQIARINRLTSPIEVYAGAPLILPEQEGKQPLARVSSLSTHQSVLELSVINNLNPWKLRSLNNLASDSEALPGDIIYSDQQSTSSVSSFSPLIQDISIAPLPLVQGETTIIRITTNAELGLSGTLQDNSLHFFKNNPGEYIALQGNNRNAITGLASIQISGQVSSGETFSLEQSVLVKPGYFRVSPPLSVSPETIDPANTKPEEDFIRSLTAPASPQRYWDGMFAPANKEPDCITAWFGDERVYNGTFKSFHAGVDFGVCAAPSLDIYAPAAGKVVFSGPLTVRGNATIIDHGWGVYSGIFHQKESYVQVGDLVQQGQLIGLIGDTGRVSGPHLHWEIWVGGQQVNPLTWLENQYP